MTCRTRAPSRMNCSSLSPRLCDRSDLWEHKAALKQKFSECRVTLKVLSCWFGMKWHGHSVNLNSVSEAHLGDRRSFQSYHMIFIGRGISPSCQGATWEPGGPESSCFICPGRRVRPSVRQIFIQPGLCWVYHNHWSNVRWVWYLYSLWFDKSRVQKQKFRGKVPGICS